MKKMHPHHQPPVRTIHITRDSYGEEPVASVRGMQQKIHRLEDILKQQEYEITTLKQLLISQSVEEHWEVPG